MNILEHMEKGKEFKKSHDCYIHAEVKDGQCVAFSTGDPLSLLIVCADIMVKASKDNGIGDGLLFSVIHDRLKEAEDAGER